MKTPIGTAIRHRRLELGKTLEEVGLKAGMDSGNLSRVERGAQAASIALLERLALALETTVANLYAMTDKSLTPSPNVVEPKNWRPHRRPVLHWDEIGSKELKEKPQRKFVAVPANLSEKAYALIVQGNMMENPSGTMPTFPAGSIITVEPVEDPDAVPSESFVIVQIKGDKLPIFRRMMKEGGRTAFITLNSQYPIIADKKFEIVGVVRRVEMDVFQP